MQLTYWIPFIACFIWLWKKYRNTVERIGLGLAFLGVLLWYGYWWLKMRGAGFH